MGIDLDVDAQRLQLLLHGLCCTQKMLDNCAGVQSKFQAIGVARLRQQLLGFGWIGHVYDILEASPVIGCIWTLSRRCETW
jgi:hypothetical protein